MTDVTTENKVLKNNAIIITNNSGSTNDSALQRRPRYQVRSPSSMTASPSLLYAFRLAAGPHSVQVCV